MKTPRATGKSFHEYLAALVDNSGRKQNEISEALGYTNPNMISMIKAGRTKLPFEKVPAFAKAVGVDPAHLMRLALKEYAPELLEVLTTLLGVACTQNEAVLLKAYRKATKDADPVITAEVLKRYESAFKA